MLKVSIAALTAALFAVGLAVSAGTPALADTHTSTDNSKLTCTLNVTVQGGKTIVTWTITGATKASIDPLTFKDGVPLKGTQTLDSNSPMHVFLVAAGWRRSCGPLHRQHGKPSTTAGRGARTPAVTATRQRPRRPAEPDLPSRNFTGPRLTARAVVIFRRKSYG